MRLDSKRALMLGWLFTLAGCPLDDLKREGADSIDQAANPAADAGTPVPQDAGPYFGYMDCIAAGKDEKACSVYLPPSSPTPSCGQADECTKEALQKCQALAPEECMELIAELCANEAPPCKGEGGEGKPANGAAICTSHVLETCTKNQMGDSECQDLLVKACVTLEVEPVDNGCVDAVRQVCREQALPDKDCKELIGQKCALANPSPPPDCSTSVLDYCKQAALSDADCKLLVSQKCDVMTAPYDPAVACVNEVLGVCKAQGLSGDACDDLVAQKCGVMQKLQ
ncbi:MAG: hypothetical protein QM778_17225 [Myxococcales bacterium]